MSTQPATVVNSVYVLHLVAEIQACSFNEGPEKGTRVRFGYS